MRSLRKKILSKRGGSYTKKKNDLVRRFGNDAGIRSLQLEEARSTVRELTFPHGNTGKSGAATSRSDKSASLSKVPKTKILQGKLVWRGGGPRLLLKAQSGKSLFSGN